MRVLFMIIYSFISSFGIKPADGGGEESGEGAGEFRHYTYPAR